MRRALPVGLFLAFSAFSNAEDVWMAIYHGEAKLGFLTSSRTLEKVGTEMLVRTDTTSELSTRSLGSKVSVRLESSSWGVSTGKPSRMILRSSSAGRHQTIDAIFGSSTVSLKVQNGQKVSTKILPLPKDALVLDEPTLYAKELAPVEKGQARTVYALDHSSLTLVRVAIRNSGGTSVKVKDKYLYFPTVSVEDPRNQAVVVFTKEGAVRDITTSIGISFRPESKEMALAPIAREPQLPDLGSSFALKSNTLIPNPRKVKSMHLTIRGAVLRNAPTDSHQQIQMRGDAYELKIQMNRPSVKGAGLIGTTQPEFGQWLLPDRMVSSDFEEVRKIAAKVVLLEKNLVTGAILIRNYVNRAMTFKPGIGILRDAVEILNTKEGVCRDYAVLTAALMRAAGIPARLVTGLYYQDGSFYYHAWVEAWSGSGWVPYDSTSTAPFVDATHIKLAQGTFEEAFRLSSLYGAKIEVEQVRY